MSLFIPRDTSIHCSNVTALATSRFIRLPSLDLPRPPPDEALFTSFLTRAALAWCKVLLSASAEDPIASLDSQ